jgi:predicted nucleotidyltransferase
MLSKEQQQIIIETLKPFNPTYIGLFGSFARNEETENSDIDLLVDFNNQKLTLFDIGGLYSLLEEKLKRKIDIAFKGKLKKQMESYITNDLITIFKA